MVRSFFKALRASGKGPGVALMLKEKMLQGEPSSCGRCQQGRTS